MNKAKNVREKTNLVQRAMHWVKHRHTAPRTAKRSFEAAQRTRFGKSWLGRLSDRSADEEIYTDHRTLVQHAREQSMNNAYAKRFYHLLKINVVGPKGFSFQSKAKKRGGKKPDTLLNQRVESNWQQWIKKGNCDVTGRYHFVALLHLWIETLARDGEVLVREIRGYPNQWGYALQILECDRLDVNYNAQLKNGHRIRMGVELDQWERPLAYHLLVNHPGENSYHYAGQEYERIPATEIIHTFVPWRPHQTRGIPWTHASMLELGHVGEYRKSELIAAELGAKKTGFYEQGFPDEDDPLGQSKGVDGPFVDEGEIVEEVEAGIYHLLPPGVKFKEHKTDHPNGNFGAFVKDSLRGVASGMGISYNRLAQDLESVNFSSLRSGELDEPGILGQIDRFS